MAEERVNRVRKMVRRVLFPIVMERMTTKPLQSHLYIEPNINGCHGRAMMSVKHN